MANAKVQTVLGSVDPSSLGMTLTHEHLCMDFNIMYTEARPIEKHMETCPFTLPNLGWLQRNPFSHPYNLRLNDDDTREAVREEMRLFKKVGGGTIVENTTTGLSRDVLFLKQLAKETGVNIVSGAGFYIARAQTDSVLAHSVETLSSILRQEMIGSTDGTDITCGFIGEIASVYPIHSFEKRVLEATGIVQSELGCGVMVHPHRVKESPFDALRLYLEAGGKADKLVMAHMDRTLLDLESLLEFAQLGSYLEFDMFGIECSHYQLNEGTDMPSDAQRVRWIKELLAEGFEERIVLAHDIYAKHRLMKFGGHGYSHLLRNIVPKMLNRGISQENIQRMLVHNPSKWLAY